MYGKAMCFHDETIAKQILQTDDVTRIKELGRLVSNYNDQIWSGMRQIIVYEGLVEKFSQNQELSDALLNTGDAFLAECAVKDKVWGIGLSMTDPKRLEPSLWRGQNLLGFALMMVRKKLKLYGGSGTGFIRNLYSFFTIYLRLIRIYPI